MKPSKHIIVSIPISATICFFTKSIYAGLICFLSGIILDIDHIVEYAVHFGLKDFSYKKLFLACEQTSKLEGEYKFEKIYLIFHSGELCIALWFISIYSRNIYLFAATIGYSIHLGLDWITNPVTPYGYFFIIRAINKFKTDKLVTKKCSKEKLL